MEEFLAFRARKTSTHKYKKRKHGPCAQKVEAVEQPGKKWHFPIKRQHNVPRMRCQVASSTCWAEHVAGWLIGLQGYKDARMRSASDWNWFGTPDYRRLRNHWTAEQIEITQPWE